MSPWIVTDVSQTPTTFAPKVLSLSVSSSKRARVSSCGLIKNSQLNHWLHICIPRRSRALASSFTSSGYLLPTSEPVKPASAISLIHCSNVSSPPSSGRSSFVQLIGAQPSFNVMLA